MRPRVQTEQPRLPHTPRPLSAVVTIALEDLPEERRTDIRAICQAVKDRATATEWLKWGEQSLVQSVRAALRTKDEDGLPRAVSIRGAYRDPEQLQFPDFVTWAYEMSLRGQQMHDRARGIARLCGEKTGRTFDPDEVIRAASAGEAVDELIERLNAA